jgi:hypothetical protein
MSETDGDRGPSRLSGALYALRSRNHTNFHRRRLHRVAIERHHRSEQQGLGVAGLGRTPQAVPDAQSGAMQ